MRFMPLVLADMSLPELRVAAATCMVDVVQYWPSGVPLPQPDPFVVTAVMCSIAGKPQENLGGYRLQQIPPPPDSWLWADIPFTTIELRVASLVLRSLRAAIRGFAGLTHQDPVWGRQPHSDQRLWVAWLAKYPDADPAAEIVEAQRILAEIQWIRNVR